MTSECLLAELTSQVGKRNDAWLIQGVPLGNTNPRNIRCNQSTLPTTRYGIGWCIVHRGVLTSLYPPNPGWLWRRHPFGDDGNFSNGGTTHMLQIGCISTNSFWPWCSNKERQCHTGCLPCRALLAHRYFCQLGLALSQENIMTLRFSNLLEWYRLDPRELVNFWN